MNDIDLLKFRPTPAEVAEALMELRAVRPRMADVLRREIFHLETEAADAIGVREAAEAYLRGQETCQACGAPCPCREALLSLCERYDCQVDADVTGTYNSEARGNLVSALRAKENRRSTKDPT